MLKAEANNESICKAAASQPVAWALIATEGAIAGDVLSAHTTHEVAFRKWVDSYQPCRIAPLIFAPPDAQ